MTKTKAKTLVSLLLDNDVAPQIRQLDTDNFIVLVYTDTGKSVSTIANIADTLTVAALVKVVEFN
jgi:hypothetical protein